MKKILVFFIGLTVCFSAWFGTSYALNGTAKQWFEDESQIEQEMPEETPGDNNGDVEEPGDNTGDVEKPGDNNGDVEKPGDNNGDVEEPGDNTGDEVETPVEIVATSLNSDIFNGSYNDIYYSNKTRLEIVLNTVDSNDNVSDVYSGDLTVSIVGAGGGIYARDMSWDDSISEWKEMTEYLGSVDGGFSNFSVLTLDGVTYLDCVNVKQICPILGGWVLNYKFTSFDMDNLPYLLIKVTTEYDTFTFKYLCCDGFN